MKEISREFIVKYVDDLEVGLVVLNYEETEDCIYIWVCREAFHAVCSECGSILNTGRVYPDIVIEDAPIYGKRTQLIWVDRVDFYKCKCGKSGRYNEDDIPFTVIGRTYTTERYIEYARQVMLSADTISSGFRFCIGNLRKFKCNKSEYLKSLSRTRCNSARTKYAVIDMVDVVNHIRHRYTESKSDSIENAIGDTARILLRNVVGAKDIKDTMLYNLFDNMKNKYSSTECAHAYKDYISGEGAPKKSSEYGYSASQSVRMAVRAEKLMESIEVDENGDFYLPRRQFFKDGLKMYMEHVDSKELSKIYKDSSDDIDKIVLNCLILNMFTIKSFKVKHGVTHIVAIDCDWVVNKDTSTECDIYHKYSYMHKRFEVEGRVYVLKYLTRVYNLKDCGEQKYTFGITRITPVFDEDTKALKEITIKRGMRLVYFEKLKLSYGYVAKDIGPGVKIDTNRAILIMLKISEDLDYISHEHGDGVLLINVMYRGNLEDVTTSKKYMSKLNALKYQKVVKAGNFDGNTVIINVVNHKSEYNIKERLMTETKYSFNVLNM